ncbi:DUF4397 domain-containing protein, partial [Brasilonema sp. CT11]|nr:DUF4397 domain-containing protein [Brasilonema sp. CT11]
LRFINNHNPDAPTPVNVLVNGQLLIEETPFCRSSGYVAFFPPEEEIEVTFVEAASGTKIAERRFVAENGYAYTLGLTGPIPGPEGQQLFNTSPFVIPDDLSMPNPDRFKGRWYRWSETNVSIDFILYHPDTPNIDEVRLRKKAPKIVIEYPEMPIGEYSFAPVLIDSSEVFINNNYNPPEPVGVFHQTITDEDIFDIIACGNSLLATNKPNTRRSVGRKYKPKYDGSCLLVDDLTVEGAIDLSGGVSSDGSAMVASVIGLAMASISLIL